MRLIVDASRYGMLIGMATTQIAIRVPDDLLRTVDRLIEEGLVESRAHAVRQALERLVDQVERLRVDRAIIEGYRRAPVTKDEEAASFESLRESIEEEPW